MIVKFETLNKKDLKGSPSRDEFKYLHKSLDRKLYACDFDFVLVEKCPAPGIVAVLDYKTPNDKIDVFTEAIAYGDLIRLGIPSYIVQGHAESGVFHIQEVVWTEHKAPTVSVKSTKWTDSWCEYEKWEQSIRSEYKMKIGVNMRASENEKPVSPIEKLELYENLLEKNIRGIERDIDEMKRQLDTMHWRQSHAEKFIHNVVDHINALNKKANQS